MSIDRKTIVLRGGIPWGFRLAGGKQTPVYIAKVRKRSKAAFAGLASGDTLLSINGLTSFNRNLKDINDVIDTITDQLILEVESSIDYRLQRHDSISSFNTRENSPARSMMDYHYYPQASYRPNPTIYSTSSPPYNRDNSRYMDSYGRSIPNPLPAMFRAAAMTSNTAYEPPRNYSSGMSSGYISDTNDHRRSTAPMRPNPSRPAPTTYYASKITSSNDPSYFSDSEYVTSGPKYTKITRQAAPNRRPSNVVLPIRSITSKAYDPYVPPESPKQAPVDLYRYQPEQNRFQVPPKITLPPQDQRRKSDSGAIDQELGAELLKSPIANKKRYADSSFFNTPFNTYPTIEEQKKMARKIAAILEGGDPSQKGASKFERQRQRAEKYTIEGESAPPPMTSTSYRPLRPLQGNDYQYSNHQQNLSGDVPDCIKHSLNEAQHSNPLRFVGAPEEFKQIHMQEHVTHTNVPPQAAMSLVADLNSNRGKGAAIFQKRKARSEKWVVDENNVKKSNYKPVQTYLGPSAKPWGQHAPSSWSGDEGPSYSPVRPKFNPPPSLPTSVPEPILPAPTTPKSAPKFADFNAKPRGFGTWNTDAPQTPRGSIDARKAFNYNMAGTSTREDSHSRLGSLFSPSQSTKNDYFQYPTDNLLNKWKGQDYSPWNQQRQEDSYPSQMPMSHDGVDLIRQRLLQSNPLSYSMSSSIPSQQQQQNMAKHFTDL